MSFIEYFYVKGTPSDLSNGIIEIQTLDFTSNYTLRISLGAERFNQSGRYSVINYQNTANLTGTISTNIIFSSPLFNVSNVQTTPVTGYTYSNMVTVDLT
jgi:hypothetical protein